jgi:phage/plasmid-like protein (TIGR03299 family)
MHGIQKDDMGIVSGVNDTWHKLPQYKCIVDRPVTIAEAVKIGTYPIEKQQLALPNGNLVEAWAIVRTDTGSTLVPAVGERFTIVQNHHMVNFISEHLLALYPDLSIQSVGTLWNGGTFFLNIAINEFQVKGDKSPTITNLMYCNPLGKGSYTACAHTTRIVCANTNRVAETQGLANQSLKKFRHTSSATVKINDHLIDMAELKLELKRHEVSLTTLAETEMTVGQVDAFLSILFPQPKEDGRGKTIAINAKAAVLNIFEGVQTQTLSKPFTKYGLFQAYTDWCDHEKTSRNADLAAVMYDGIMGIRADKKQAVLEALIRA